MVPASASRGHIRFTVEENDSGKRLDHLVASRLTDISRTRISQMIRDGSIRVADIIRKPGYRVSAGEIVSGALSMAAPPEFAPERVDFEVIHADESCIVINKPPGLVVHPSPGHLTGTLAHGLLYQFPELAAIGPEVTRPGIVHRLDKDTSGLLLIARTAEAHRYFSDQFKIRAIHKVYVAFVFGNPQDDHGQIALPISRHPIHRQKMTATTTNQGRPAETIWRVIQRFDGITFMEFTIKTGRTHQIRVHSAAIGHQIIGDPTYGYKNPIKSHALNAQAVQLVKRVDRQLLHARTLSFVHPETALPMTFEAPIPDDMTEFHEALLALEAL